MKGGRGRRSVRGEEEPRSELDDWALWKSLAICFGGALACFLLKYPLREHGWQVSTEIATEVGIAFLVAGVLTLTLEYNAKRLLHREVKRFLDSVAKDVYTALLERVVPEEIFDELNDILRTDVVRRNCEYHIVFAKPYSDMPKGYFVLRRTLTFTVENQLSRRTTFFARSVYAGSEDLASTAWRGRHFHSRLEVNGEDIPLEEGRNLFERDDQIVLEHPVHLGPHETAEVLLQGEEPCWIEASRTSYIQGTPVIGIRVTLQNEYPEAIGQVAVEMNHPAREEMKYTAAMGRYVLDRAFLPGQGLQIFWHMAEARQVTGEGGEVTAREELVGTAERRPAPASLAHPVLLAVDEVFHG
jgi:hypothetical protein